MSIIIFGIAYYVHEVWIYRNRRNNVDRMNGVTCVDLRSLCGKYRIVSDQVSLERALAV